MSDAATLAIIMQKMFGTHMNSIWSAWSNSQLSEHEIAMLAKWGINVDPGASELPRMPKGNDAEKVQAASEVLESWKAIPNDFDLPEEPPFMLHLMMDLAHLHNVWEGYPDEQ